MEKSRFEDTIRQFDTYNAQDPKNELVDGEAIPSSLLYAHRMTKKLLDFEPTASAHLQLAARCQHIGRWEIARSSYPMDRSGYLKWRSQLKIHHAEIASDIMKKTGYEPETIALVKDLLLKKHLKENPETQTLEDVVCLVFLQHYFDDFSSGHEEEKLVTILRKTIVKMSEKGVHAAMQLPLSAKAIGLIGKAVR